MIGIPCHKLVLSLSSSYFAALFEKIPNQPNNHVTYVVLPLSYNAVKILVHYMYRGESRVSNDILKEVLHGGDYLKIRGLCRTENGGGKENKCSDQQKSDTGESVVETLKPAHSRAATPLNTFSSNVHEKESINLHKIPTASVNQSQTKLSRNKSPPRTSYRSAPVQPVASTTLIAKPPPKVQAKVVARSSEAQRTSSSSSIGFLTIKEEPVEWTEQYEVTSQPLQIKEERIELPTSDTEYQRLCCEICRESFQMPSEWVKHVEHKHTELTLTVPKKRRKSEFVEDDDNIASLRCDLCSTYFLTPAEWVKHVQSKHTEMELAMENEKLSLVTQGGTSDGGAKSINKAACYSGSKR